MGKLVGEIMIDSAFIRKYPIGFFSNFSTKPHILYEGAIFLRKFNIKN